MSDAINISRKELNTQFRTPLNYLHWLENLQAYGTEGYASRSRDIKNRLCVTEEAVNDAVINAYLLEYADTTGLHIGQFLKWIYDIDQIDWASITTLTDLFGNSEACKIVMNHPVTAQLIAYNSVFRDKALAETVATEQLFDAQNAMEEWFKSGEVTPVLLGDATVRLMFFESFWGMRGIAKQSNLQSLLTTWLTTITNNQKAITNLANCEDALSYLKQFTGSNLNTMFNASIIAVNALFDSELAMSYALNAINNTYLHSFTNLNIMRVTTKNIEILKKVVKFDIYAYLRNTTAYALVKNNTAYFSFGSLKTINIDSSVAGTYTFPDLENGKFYAFNTATLYNYSGSQTGIYLKIEEYEKQIINLGTSSVANNSTYTPSAPNYLGNEPKLTAYSTSGGRVYAIVTYYEVTNLQ